MPPQWSGSSYPAGSPQSAPPAYPYSAPPAAQQSVQPVTSPVPDVSNDLVPVTTPAYGTEPTLVQIGQIAVTATTVHTPNGALPLRGSQWVVNDHVYTTQKIATWAIVCAIVGFFCLTVFSLLFLLFKETKHSGFLEVAVSGSGTGFVTQVPIASQAAAAQVHQQVNYVRSLSMR